MAEIARIASKLRQRPDGVWVSDARTEVSYPSDGARRMRAVEDESFWFRHRSDCIVETLRAFPPGGALFDIGGGNGVVSLALTQAGFEAVLLEPGAEATAMARARGVPQVIRSTLEDAGIEPGTLPAAGLFDVLEHVADDAGFLRTLARLLAPGARLYLTVPAHPLLWSAEDEYAGHQRRYSLGSLERTLAGAGFGVERATSIFLMLPLPILLFRTLPTRLGWRDKQSRQRELAEHHTRPLGAAILGSWHALERRAVRMGLRIPFGATYLAVARAPLAEGRDVVRRSGTFASFAP